VTKNLDTTANREKDILLNNTTETCSWLKYNYYIRHTWWHFTWCVNLRTTQTCSNFLWSVNFFFFLNVFSLVQTINTDVKRVSPQTIYEKYRVCDTTRCVQSTVLLSYKCWNILVRREICMEGLILGKPLNTLAQYISLDTGLKESI
jgi:hypothetical protein